MANIVDMEYCGYPNRETYDMVLNLGNEYDIAKPLEWVAEAGQLDLYEFTEWVKDYFETLENSFPDLYRQIRDDVGSLWRVDWEAVANHFMEE